MSSIPEEMYHEILVRLPVESLLVCKSVCKNWYAQISSSGFVNAHIAIQKNNPILMLQGSTMWSNWNLLYSVDYDSLASPDADKIKYPFRTVGRDFQLLGSCHGLVCIRLFDDKGRTDCICLWNPATREYKAIPKSPKEFDRWAVHLCAFGYDRKTGDYKLAIGMEADGTEDTSLVQVYTLSSNSWKSGLIVVPYKFPCTQKSGVLVNGDLHWLAIAQGNIILLSLDIGKESFKEMPLPIEKDQHPHMNLGELEGCLCILVSSYANGVKTHVEVWKMLDYGVRESWTKYHVISHESILADRWFLRLIGSFKNGKLPFLSCDVLVLYDPKNGSAREQKSYNFPLFVEAEIYFESLVSLNSGTHVR